MERLSRDVSADGLVTTSYVDDEGQLIVDYRQDAAPAFELVKDVRQDGHAWRKGMKDSMVHAFHIPSGVIMELRGIGVDVYTAPFKDVVWGLKRLHRFEACDMTGKRLA